MIKEITPEIRLIATMFGQMRAVINRKEGVQDAKMGPQNGTLADIDGMIAELVFAKWKNVWPDLSLLPRTGSPDVIVGHEGVDIKSTRLLNGRLLSTVKETADVEIYVLAIVQDDCVRFPGFAFYHELRSPKHLTDLGHGQTYAMDQEELRPF